MEENLEIIKKTLKKYSQEHLLNGYEGLDEVKQKQLLGQIQSTDFELINSLYNNTKKELQPQEYTIAPIEFLDKEKLNGYYKSFQETGEKAIRAGKLAAVTMAGGQGTRLGHAGPKGTYDIGLESHKSLFELLSDSLKDQGKVYGVTIPWFIMTSEENNKDTIEFFAKNRYFGYEKDKQLQNAIVVSGLYKAKSTGTWDDSSYKSSITMLVTNVTQKNEMEDEEIF